MMTNDFSTNDLDDFAIRFICSRVRKLIRYAGFDRWEAPNLFQEFAADLVERRKKFDSARGTWEAFVVVVSENKFVRILEHRKAHMRSPKREAGSLNQLTTNADGEDVERISMISETEHALRTGYYKRSAQEQCELQIDVAALLDTFPPRMRKVCEIIMCESKAAAARTLGISKGTLQEILGRILRRFEQAGMREYLK